MDTQNTGHQLSLGGDMLDTLRLRLGVHVLPMLWRSLYHCETKLFFKLPRTPRRRLDSALSMSNVLWFQVEESLVRSALTRNLAEPAMAVNVFILGRMAQLQTAVDVLCRKRLYSEASILALTQLELGLDVLYVGRDSERAKTWFDHSSMQQHPWKVRAKIDWVTAHKKDNYRFLTPMFRMLSAIKHGNPIMTMFSLKDFAAYGGTSRVAFEREAVYTCVACTTATICLLDALRDFLDNFHIDDEGDKKLKDITKEMRIRLLSEWLDLLKDTRSLLKAQKMQL